MISNYDEFCAELTKAGFTLASGGNDEGVFSLLGQAGGAVKWHTGDPVTDPWEWRMRVLNEREDIAYGKVFFGKAGYITEEWYPYFLAVRRGGKDFDEAYSEGTISRLSKTVYDLIRKNGGLSLHEVKALGGFGKEDSPKIEKALTDLQTGLFITISGHKKKISKSNADFGWITSVFRLTESFWPPSVFEKAASVNSAEAEEAITGRIYRLNPSADGKKVKRFICGK